MSQSIPNRFFWSWDHSTNWTLHAYGAQNCGVSNAYAKAPEVFLQDYRRVVDYASEHRINAVGIAGLLREKHGGVESVRSLCEYANKKDVRIYMIAGLFAYGGIFYEGDHPYSLNRFLEKNPDSIAKTSNGDPFYAMFQGMHGYRAEPQGCPSDAHLHDFVLESLDWLFKEIPELGGIQIEAGDNGICHCSRCRTRRGVGNGAISSADMAGIYPDAVNAILGRSPDALVICEAYRHFKNSAYDLFETDHPDEDLKKLFAMPDKVFWQWTCDSEIKDHSWNPGDSMLRSLKKFNHVMRSHAGTQWRGGQRAGFAVEEIRQQCMLSYLSGLQAVSIFGESSPFHTNAEFNYLALEYFADHPLAPMNSFVCDVMSPLLGGDGLASFYFRSATCLDIPQKIPEIVAEIGKITSSVREYEVLRRWQYLASNLNGFYWESVQQKGI